MALLAVVAACSRGNRGGPPIKLDGTPHPASDPGVVTTADRQRVVLDRSRRYAVGAELLVFIPGTLKIAPLASAVGRYALIGVRNGEVVWVEPLSVVLDEPGIPKTAFYEGTLARVDGRSGIFADGTVLDLDPGLTVPPSLPRAVRADIDPGTHRVREFTPG